MRIFPENLSTSFVNYEKKKNCDYSSKALIRTSVTLEWPRIFNLHRNEYSISKSFALIEWKITGEYRNKCIVPPSYNVEYVVAAAIRNNAVVDCCLLLNGIGGEIN